MSSSSPLYCHAFPTCCSFSSFLSLAGTDHQCAAALLLLPLIVKGGYSTKGRVKVSALQSAQAFILGAATLTEDCNEFFIFVHCSIFENTYLLFE